jgi:hypothetical protein
MGKGGYIMTIVLIISITIEIGIVLYFICDEYYRKWYTNFRVGDKIAAGFMRWPRHWKKSDDKKGAKMGIVWRVNVLDDSTQVVDAEWKL